MRTTHYTAEIRVLLCENCGAPLDAPLAGGSLVCGYCRAANIIENRDERPTIGMPAVPTPIDENERLNRLRLQDRRPMTPPASLLPLLAGSTLDPAKVQEAFMIYQATRKEVRATGSPEAAERLYFLTLVASNYLLEQGDDSRRRALLETSLDTLFLPRHKQVIRCALASAAAREGDLAAAERWIAPCDARAIDIESDSAYRCARAYLDTCRNDFAAVLRTLGSAEEQIPIVDARDPMATVLRANALERLGHGEAAVAVLRSRMSAESAAGREAIESFVRLNPQLQLCPQSLPIARQGHAQKAADVAASSAGGGVGATLAIVGVGLLVLAVGLVSFSVVPSIWFVFRTGGTFHIEGILAGIGTGAVMAAGPGIAGVIMMLVGGGLWRSAREARYMRLHGLSARGVVRGIERTGMKINNVPVMRVIVTVMRDGTAPYEASFKQILPMHLQAQLTPGTEVPLRVHPKDPRKIIFEMR